MKRKSLSQAKLDNLAGHLFIAPQFIGFLLFVAVPIFAVIIFSFQDRNLLTGTWEWIGFDNYSFMFTKDPYFYKVVRNSLVFSFGLIIMNVSLALFLALILFQNKKGMVFFRTLFFSPVVTSTVAWVLVWSFMLQSNQGTINQFLNLIGIQGPNWLGSTEWAMFSVIFIRVIKNVGLNMVILIAALKDVPYDLVEAARVDGANTLQCIRKIIIPMIAPTILLVVIITLIGSMNVFDHIMLLTAGGPSNSTLVLAYYVYYQAFLTNEIGYASALAVVLFVVVLGLTFLQWNMRKKWVYYEQ
ncbi:MAG: sugar ABC transporter permease [Chloroflexi bacterium]|nr:sugar ABC transporter permease [Chloroflexota bacterium]